MSHSIQMDYGSDFCAADSTIATGRVAMTTGDRLAFWNHWCDYARPLGINPALITATFQEKTRAITGFAQWVRTGRYGRQVRVSAGRVLDALRAVGQTCEEKLLWLHGIDIRSEAHIEL